MRGAAVTIGEFVNVRLVPYRNYAGCRDARARATQHSRIMPDASASTARRGPVEPSVVRAVKLFHVVTSFGWQLRSGSSGSETTFELSEAVPKLDVFLSHSWRDNGFLKYLALCWHFNAVPAAFAGLLTGFALCSYQRASGTPLTPTASFGNFAAETLPAAETLGLAWMLDGLREPWNDPNYEMPVVKICQPVGLVVFLLVLFFGHHLTPTRRVFLDKICIHQTDPIRKAQGIAAIDEFIHRSQTMFILYNDDYFERLWCCFELGARASTGGDLVLLPLLKAPACISIIVFLSLSHAIEWAGLIYDQTGDDRSSFLVISFAALLMPFCIFTGVSIMACKQKLRLLTQLKSFSLSKAKCYAESDRPLVERSIAEWFKCREQGADQGRYQPSNTEALAKFEECVREGEVFTIFMRRIGKQPGLLRAADLGFCFLFVLWLQTCDLISVYDERKSLWNSGIAMGGLVIPADLVFSFLCASWIIELVVKRFPDTPSIAFMALTPLPICILYALLIPLFVLNFGLTKGLL